MSGRDRFTVSGPGEQDHGAPSLGAGISVAQTFACRHRRDVGDVSFYVREAGDVARAVVTKTEAGPIVTQVCGPGEQAAA